MTNFRDNTCEQPLEPSTIGTLTLQGALAKEGWALEKIHRTYHHRVFRWCREKGLDTTDSEDATQTVFLKLLSGIQRFARNGEKHSLGAWLRCITQRKSIDIHRDRKRSKLEYWPTLELAQTSCKSIETCISPSSPTDVAWSQHVKDAMEIAQGECEPQTWLAFEEVVINGRQPNDVAAQLGISRNSVYLAKSRILRRLRELLA